MFHVRNLFVSCESVDDSVDMSVVFTVDRLMILVTLTPLFDLTTIRVHIFYRRRETSIKSIDVARHR